MSIVFREFLQYPIPYKKIYSAALRSASGCTALRLDRGCDAHTVLLPVLYAVYTAYMVSHARARDRRRVARGHVKG